jgi:CheY-like chemotaxis protein
MGTPPLVCKGQPVAGTLTGSLPDPRKLPRLTEDAMPFPPDAPRPPSAPPTALSGADALPLRGITLLVVDDSRFASDALRLICIRLGARLRRAETLAAARAFLASHRPDVVIVDLGLPDGRGEDLITDLSRNGVPVLATSGDPEGRAPALAAGACGYLDKPVPGVAAFQQLILGSLGLAHPPPDSAPHAPATPDTLAFRDDLARASPLIGGADSSYATGFLRSLGRSAGDHALEAAALAAADGPATGPGQAALARLVTARLAEIHPLA